jgi:tetratricopeptide (TPR) repeat protein
MVKFLPHLIETEDLFTIYQTLLLVYLFQGLYQEATHWGERCKEELSTRVRDELVVFNLYLLAISYSGQGRYEEAEELLVKVLEIGEKSFNDSDYKAMAAQVFSELGGIRAARGKFEQAEEDCQKAVKLKEEINSSNSPTVADSLLTLAEVCRLRGQYHKAEEYYTQAFDIYSEVIEVEGYDNINPIYIAIGYINISVLLLDQGQNEGCEFLGQQAIEIVEATLGNEHPLYATCLSNLAGACLNQGKHQQAEECCQTAIAINQEKNNTGHPSYAISLINLASIYMAQGRFDEAVVLYERALNVQRQIYGTEHHQVAEALVSLGIAYLAQNKYEDAERCLSEGQEMYQLTLGTTHPKYGELLSELASVRGNQEQYDEAEQLLRDAIQVFRAAYGEIHPKIGEKLAILAFLLLIQERYEDAKELFQQSLDIIKGVFGEDDPNICEYILFIAELNYNIGHKEEADNLYAQASGIYEQGRDKKINPDFSQGLMILIELYESQKRYQEVEALYERLIDTTRRLLGDNYPNVALLLTRLAKLKLDGWNYDEAAKLYEEALEIRRRIFSDNHALVATSMVNLAYAYRALNRFLEAKELYVQALDIRIQVYGNSHHQVVFVKNALAGLDYALEKSKQSSTKSLPTGEIPPRSNSASSASETIAIQSQVNETIDVLHQDFTTQSETAERKTAEIQALEQKKAELESQMLQLEAQQEALEAEIERYQQRSQADQANLLTVAEQLIRLTRAERAKLTEPLSLVLADLEEQRQEYQQTWDRLQTAIQQFNTYQEETDEIRFHLEAHYQADNALTQTLPLNRRKVEHILQVIREQLAELDKELANARSQHERAQQKSIIRF